MTRTRLHRHGLSTLAATAVVALLLAPSAFAQDTSQTSAAEAPAAGQVIDGSGGQVAEGQAAAPAIDPLSGLPLDPNVPVEAALLPHDLSPWGMFLQADWVVKSVMIGLAFASVITWTVWLAKTLELSAARHRSRRTLQVLQGSATLGEAVANLQSASGAAAALVQAAAHEMRLSAGLDSAGIKERLALVNDRIVHAAGRQAGKATGLLATIGATAPFVGLFGTVWGIMNSFIGISEAQTTNLAVVAPGIAEALLATAIGLAAAIPAVVIYNHFTRLIGAYRALLNDAAAGVMQLVSRDLDRDPHRHRGEFRRDAAE
jgi:biopolymer transport protein ExbB